MKELLLSIAVTLFIPSILHADTPTLKSGDTLHVYLNSDYSYERSLACNYVIETWKMLKGDGVVASYDYGGNFDQICDIVKSYLNQKQNIKNENSVKLITDALTVTCF